MSKDIAAVYADGWSRIVATMIRLTGDWSLAEECAQEAFATALRVWPESGTPDQPLAWLTTVARRTAIDRVRRAAVEREKLREVAMEPAPWTVDAEIPDDRLELMFTCCHPALNVEAQVALTLRGVAGMSTAEIARAFLVPEKTMGQRIFRAKQRIKQAGIPFRVPPGHLLPERLSAVLHVLYLLFNEGYSGAGELCREAIRIGRTLAGLMPDEPEALGLLALMLVQDARREARTGADGTLLTLDEQDRTRWDRERIDEGATLCERALRHGKAGPFQLQAAIAVCHATASGTDDTDWTQIAGLYEHLRRVAPSPVVDLNRAVAVAMASGPHAGLELVDAIDELDGYHLLHATRADLLRRAGRDDEAVDSWRRALELAPTEAERQLLSHRLAAAQRTGLRTAPPTAPQPAE
ncbi:sigma-70 family RNA polymerase sigma factor [Actinoplanes sichuanensis]|uniref:RNA polymerase sigma factor n=1 Tax=Actinoplanes sichuanensis TaxID=512349 RepID=A0ABW4ASY1_9ACTN|nr:RNA polymerase sigma factor [Actinoplanes sichuanensis]BEL07135.1 sigma-70 family RNA polymerase sigma factor [Actinoplanes sichuanensis]